MVEIVSIGDNEFVDWIEIAPEEDLMHQRQELEEQIKRIPARARSRDANRLAERSAAIDEMLGFTT